MWKIRYNIAENKKIDYVKFAFFSSVVVLISLLFVMLGVGNLWSSDKRVKEQKEAAELNENLFAASQTVRRIGSSGSPNSGSLTSNRAITSPVLWYSLKELALVAAERDDYNSCGVIMSPA